MIIGGILLILWGGIGGFDWVFDSFDCFTYEYTSVIEELYSSNHNYVKTLFYKDAIIDNKIRSIELLEQEIKFLKQVNEIQQQNLKIANQLLLEAVFQDTYVENE